MKTLLAGGAIIAASLVGAGASASAAPAPLYPPQPPIVNVTLNLSITIINFGGTVNVNFIGCQIGELVAIGFNGGTSLTQCFGFGGSVVITAPADAGVFPVTAVGLESGIEASRNLIVAEDAPEVAGVSGAFPAAATPAVAGASGAAAAPAADASASLPATGASSTDTLLIAGSTLLAGLGLAGVAVRRRRQPAI